MRNLSKAFYWVASLIGVAAWTGGIMLLSQLPLVAEFALGAMALVVCIWGHAVLFQPERPQASLPAPGRHSREEALRATGVTNRLPLGAPRPVTSRPARSFAQAQLPPAGELPTLLRTPLDEAARMEARRLGEALTAAGLFGPVSVRVDADGTALVAPVREAEGVRLPAEAVVRFAAYVMLPNGLASEGNAGGGAWPGRDLAAAIEAHLNAALPATPPADRPRAERTTRLPDGWTTEAVGPLARPA